MDLVTPTRSSRGWSNIASIVIVTLALSSCGRAPSEAISMREAIAAGDEDAVADIIRTGQDPDEVDETGMTPLMLAAAKDDVALVEALLGAGAGIDHGGRENLTSTHVAALADSPFSLSALLDAGADPERQSANGMNAFHHAAAAGSLEALRIIAPLVSDIDARSDAVIQGHGYPRIVGPPAIGLATISGEARAVGLLLELGADPNAPSHSGHTPLLIAVFTNQSLSVAGTLLDAGADRAASSGCEQGCSLSDDQELDVEGWARQLERRDLIELLSSH